MFVTYCDYVKKVLFDYIIYTLIEEDGLEAAKNSLDTFFRGSEIEYRTYDTSTEKETFTSGKKLKGSYSLFTRRHHLRRLAGMLSKNGMERVIKLYDCKLPSEYIEKMLKKTNYIPDNKEYHTKKRINH